MKRSYFLVMLFVVSMLLSGCSGSNSDGSGSGSGFLPAIVVNSIDDQGNPPEGTITLRSALNSAKSGQAIVFDDSLDGQTIELSIVGEEHTLLKGEVMGMRNEPSGPVSYLVGYFDRDYGRSALYAHKDVVIDASDLPLGITIEWTGGLADPARVLAVYGDLTLTNVTITGGRSVTEDISTPDPDDEDQLWTLARGGALAVWGRARISNCKLYDNHCVGDFDSSRDRGAYGGGLYANIVDVEDSIVSGNTVLGGGAAGGGIFSLGGAEISDSLSSIRQSSICGNKISALFTYGGGVYSDGGGIGNRKTLRLVNCTIANNVVEPVMTFPSFLLAMGYWRGGGIYMSNGYMQIYGCTVVENEVYGVSRTDSLGKANMAGGIAATIGNAHGVEEMVIGQSIITGNSVYEFDGATYNFAYNQDIFTGSLLYFRSKGYNRIGVVDFSQILVPVGETNWRSLCRKHYPKQGDSDGVDMADVLNLTTGIIYSNSILSEGVNAGALVPVYYEPAGSALDQIPSSSYEVEEIFAEYTVYGGSDNFLSIFLDRVESEYGLTDFASDFTADFEAFLQTVDADEDTPEVDPYTEPVNDEYDGDPILTLADTQWFGPAETWPKELYNYPYIHFWHHLDTALEAAGVAGMGQELIGDDAWDAMFSSGDLDENNSIRMRMFHEVTSVSMESLDQINTPRPANGLGDIGAVEMQ